MDIAGDGVTLHVEVDGPDDAPPVLVLHGITSSTATWDWLVPRLVPSHRVLRLDFRGHGDSGRTPGQYGPAGYLSDAVAAAEAAGAPCIVVGHSLGGITAASLAQARPDLVRGLVLEDPPLGPPTQLEGNSLLDAFAMLRQTVPLLQTSGLDAPALGAMLAGAPSMSGPPMGEVLTADALEAMGSSLLRLDVTVLDLVVGAEQRSQMQWVFDVDRPIGVPTVVVAADPASPDGVCRPEAIAALQRGSGDDVQVHVVDDCGHLVHDSIAHRESFAEIALAHIASLS
jgi:pimeloyl-ACP methyl ester carboxylesterase